MIHHLLRCTAPRSVADTLCSDARRHCTLLVINSMYSLDELVKLGISLGNLEVDWTELI